VNTKQFGFVKHVLADDFEEIGNDYFYELASEFLTFRNHDGTIYSEPFIASLNFLIENSNGDLLIEDVSMDEENLLALEENKRLLAVFIRWQHQNPYNDIATLILKALAESDFCSPATMLKLVQCPLENGFDTAQGIHVGILNNPNATSAVRNRIRKLILTLPTKDAKRLSKFITQIEQTLSEEFSTDLKNIPDSTSSEPDSATFKTFKVGDKVKHEKFGNGTIIATAGEGNWAEATIAFKKAGEKRLLLRHSGMEICK